MDKVEADEWKNLIKEEAETMPSGVHCLMRIAELATLGPPTDPVEAHNRIWEAFYLGKRYMELLKQGKMTT